MKATDRVVVFGLGSTWDTTTKRMDAVCTQFMELEFVLMDDTTTYASAFKAGRLPGPTMQGWLHAAMKGRGEAFTTFFTVDQAPTSTDAELRALFDKLKLLSATNIVALLAAACSQASNDNGFAVVVRNSTTGNRVSTVPYYPLKRTPFQCLLLNYS